MLVVSFARIIKGILSKQVGSYGTTCCQIGFDFGDSVGEVHRNRFLLVGSSLHTVNIMMNDAHYMLLLLQVEFWSIHCECSPQHSS